MSWYKVIIKSNEIQIKLVNKRIVIVASLEVSRNAEQQE